MTKFWKWMYEKDYASDLSYETKTIYDKEKKGSVHPTHNMLIGYMIEYLEEKTQPHLLLDVAINNIDIEENLYHYLKFGIDVL